MKLYRACAYIIVDEDKLLAADRGYGRSEPVTEGKPWVSVAAWQKKAKSAGERIPFIVWDAKNLNRWLGWGLLVDLRIQRIDENHRQTTFTFENLKPLGNLRRTDLHLLEQERPISGNFIRSYARLETPTFLREAVMANGPLLSEWLCTVDAVAHAFRCAYEDDEQERHRAEQVLARIIRVTQNVAHGNWAVLVTPGRLRVIVGQSVIAGLGCADSSYPGTDLWFNPETPDEPDDEELCLTDLYTKYERQFEVRIKNLVESCRGNRTHSEVIDDYLANNGHPIKPGQTRYDQTTLVIEYLQTRELLEA